MWLSKKEYKALTDKLDSLEEDCRELSRGIRSINEKQKTLERRMKQIQGKEDTKGKKGAKEKKLPYRSVELSDGSIMESYEYKELVNDILGVTSSYGLAVGDLKFIFELISRDAGDRTIPV